MRKRTLWVKAHISQSRLEAVEAFAATYQNPQKNPQTKSKTMEMGCLTFTSPSPPPRSFNRHYAADCNHQLPLPTTTCRTRRRPFSVRASDSDWDKSCSPITRHTLSSKWNVSNYTSPSKLPTFEELDATNMLLRHRIVFLGSQVDDTSADFAISQLLLLDKQDPTKDIKLFINSPGGSVTAGLGIYDAMKMCKADVSTVCVGLAASMGAFILAAGTKGKRFCMPNARVMIHQARGGAGGETEEVVIQIRELSYLAIKLNKILSRITGKSYDEVEQDTRRDLFLNAWETVEYGLADGVIDDGKPGLVAPLVEALPPPEERVSDLLTVEEGWVGKQEWPSEEKFLQK